MGEPVVVNGVGVVMTKGAAVKTSFFALGHPHAKAGGFPLVTQGSLLGGLTFVATLFTLKTFTQPGNLPVILVGANVTDSDNYSGVLTPLHGAGIKFNLV